MQDRFITGFCLIALLFFPFFVHAENEISPWTNREVDRLVTIYRDFHTNPELSFREERTAAKLAVELKSLGIDVTEGVGRLGVVGLLKNGDGPVVMIRTDLDALPVTEVTGLPYASKVVAKDPKGNDVGVMHACGHDIHMTCQIGVARYLAAHKDRWHGTVMFVGQPAEETVGGAEAMLKDGLFTRFPRPKYALALHVDSNMPTGKVGYKAGYFLANVDSVDILIKGKGGHGAFPQTTVDPIVQAAHLIVDLQTLISRENNPFEPAVITVGSIHGGTKHNIIGDSCRLQLTVRSYSPEVRELLTEGIKRKAKAVAMSSGAPEPVVEFSDSTPATKNDADLVERVVPSFRRVLGDEQVIPVEPSMGGEDFSQYGLAGVPIFMFRLGSINGERLAEMKAKGKMPPSLHSPLYYPDPRETITTGVTAMAAAVVDLLKGQ
ncbi:amidohydrolase [Schlesneria paludicola]|uniref:amidohydrolase n=1 Tax=Schlesneria paludicola TaxID=360056 RepID=UPI00029B2BDC|nr:amidohydrolase [Schlesneria paludicola]